MSLLEELEKVSEANHLLDSMYNQVSFLRGVTTGCEFAKEYMYRGDVPTVHAKKQITAIQDYSRRMQMKAKVRALIAHDRVLTERNINV